MIDTRKIVLVKIDASTHERIKAILALEGLTMQDAISKLICENFTEEHFKIITEKYKVVSIPIPTAPQYMPPLHYTPPHELTMPKEPQPQPKKSFFEIKTPDIPD